MEKSVTKHLDYQSNNNLYPHSAKYSDALFFIKIFPDFVLSHEKSSVLIANFAKAYWLHFKPLVL